MGVDTMALMMIVVIRKDTPGKVFAYHTAGQSNTVSQVYPGEEYQAFVVPYASIFPGDDVDVSGATEIELVS